MKDTIFILQDIVYRGIDTADAIHILAVILASYCSFTYNKSRQHCNETACKHNYYNEGSTTKSGSTFTEEKLMCSMYKENHRQCYNTSSGDLGYGRSKPVLFRVTPNPGLDKEIRS